MFFLEIKKCFDNIDHDILLNKLSRYGVNGYEALWFNSNLSHRSQQVKCNGWVSKQCVVPIGIPQGSVLGPLLFMFFFVNDISCHAYICNVNLYTDDTVLYCTGNTVDKASQNLQVALNGVLG